MEDESFSDETDDPEESYNVQAVMSELFSKKNAKKKNKF